MPINCFSYNIRGSSCSDFHFYDTWNYRKDSVAKLISSFDLDLICFQEDDFKMYSFLKKKLKSFQSYGFNSMTKPLGGSEFNSVFFNSRKLRILSKGGFFFSNTPLKPSKFYGMKYYRSCTWVKFSNKATKKSFYVFNLHLDNNACDQIQIKCLKVLFKKIKSIAKNESFVVVGDFNFKPTSRAYKKIYKVLVLSSSVKGESVVAWGLKPRMKSVIDYVFASDKKMIKKCGFVNVKVYRNGRKRYPSDHKPIKFQFLV
ncbi:MAG: endonuclease/exonuclease/phosphatase family protein [Candidatus Micrarchaeota archaeon]